MKTTRLHPVRDDGIRLCAELHWPREAPHGIALLFHGLLSSRQSSTNRWLIPVLNNASLASLTLDFMGHGDSDGDQKETCFSSGVEDVVAALAAMRREVPQTESLPMISFGSSFGGAVALVSAPHVHPAGIVLKSPALGIADFQRRIRGDAVMAQWEKEGELLLPEFGPEVSLSYRFIADSLQYDTTSLAQSFDGPIAVVHGTQDETVPVEQSRTLASHLGNRCDFLEIERGDHRFSHPDDFNKALHFCASALLDMFHHAST